MKLTLLSELEYTNLTLPPKKAGRYFIRGKNENGKLIDIIAVEAEKNVTIEWIIKSNKRFSLIDNEGNAVQSVVIEASQLLKIQSADKNTVYTLLSESVTDDRNKYTGYSFTQKQFKLTVGRGENSDIQFDNRFVSNAHAEIEVLENGIMIRDLDSTNNTYVNGKAISDKLLSVGDLIYILGLQIIIGNGFLFLNNPDGKVTVKSENLSLLEIPAFNKTDDEDYKDEPADYYFRAPRFKYDVKTFELKVDPPPDNQDKDEVPLLMLVGPSITMGMASVASGGFAVTSAIERGDISSAIPSIVMCTSMLLGTLMWPLITKSYQKRIKKRKEALRQKKYTEYLEELKKILEKEISRQEIVLRDNDVNTATLVSRVLKRMPDIWERTPKHSDFLSLRLGDGDLPLNANIQYSERRFTLEQDNLTEMMYKFGEAKRTLKNVPICLPLRERFVSGIFTDKKTLIETTKKLVLQITVLHSYDEVKLCFIYGENDEEAMSFARFLPHTLNNEKTLRYVATNSDEIKELSSALDPIIEYRKDLPDSKLEDESPYYVIICLEKELSVKTECVKRILEHKTQIKFSVLAMFERLADLPKESSAVVSMQNNGNGKLTLIDDVSDEPIAFSADRGKVDTSAVTKVLANTFIDKNGTNFTLPKRFTFFEMLDIGFAEHLNLTENWRANDPTQSLAAAIGVDRYGETFKLDLHERAHGPHGLIAGMTGSGKSEFIISYILSMAVNFHPYEVAFILIDYKGGGMAKSFENIPHTAGVITNLDGNGIKRSLSSMRSELHRRERIFAETSKSNNISNIDIYKYQKLYREGKVTEPLPHLIIISDEFAELKKEQPDFMTELTSTARVGRSLGVHLILATQKPGGVVDDQIRSNSRFRISLKVQYTGDSMEMLGRPDAASLTDTGRFYLLVGYNELFETGQSAWAGAPYYPSAKTIKDRGDAVSVISAGGRVIAEANTNRFAHLKDPKKQLDVITSYIEKVSQNEGIKRFKMWLDPIPAKVFTDELCDKYKTETARFSLAPVVGEYDDPAHQKQGVLRVPITDDGNVIVYGSAGSGKEMFIEAMCYSLLGDHSPDEVNLYILDFGAETLTAFSEAPNVGDVILSFETEKIDNLFKLLEGKINTRKKLLSEFGGSLFEYNAVSENPQPNIVVIINNFAAFIELFENKAAELGYLTREGTKYGIYFVLSCTGINNVRFSLLQNFKRMYCLQLNNTDDYTTVVGKTEGLLPEKFKGRGMFRESRDCLYEFQTAHITRAPQKTAFIRNFAKKLAQKYNGNKTAVKIPVLPEKVTADILEKHVRKGTVNCVPIGIEKLTLDVSYYDFTENVISLVMSQNSEYGPFLDGLEQFISEKCGVKTFVLSNAETVSDIFNLVLKRNNSYKDSKERPVFEPVAVIIKSISALRKTLESTAPTGEKAADDDTPQNRLRLALEKCRREYGVYFIIGESVNALTAFTAEGWYKEHVNPQSGIWVGSGISSQYRLSVSKKPPGFSSEQSPKFGFAVRDGEAVLVKLLDVPELVAV
jgi:S-DNA-T family DNA segregation ATPase FtsK/SpoIIIE